MNGAQRWGDKAWCARWSTSFWPIVIDYPALERWKNNSVGGFALP